MFLDKLKLNGGVVMDNAFCTITNQTYSAYQFSQFDIETISQRRKFLECPTCHAPAFFRKAARNGQAACFGARPHNDGCIESTPLSRLVNGENDDEDILHNDGQRIVLDLNYGAVEPVNHINDDINENGAGRGIRFIGNGNRPNAVAHRRLSTILRSLVINPEFQDSRQIIEIGDRNEIISDFFVPFNDISQNHIGSFRGYWGQIADIGRTVDDTIWLNSGGREDVSLCLPEAIQRRFFERFRINTEEDLVGSYILYLGDLRVSQNNKHYIVIDELAFVTCY